MVQKGKVLEMRKGEEDEEFFLEKNRKS